MRRVLLCLTAALSLPALLGAQRPTASGDPAEPVRLFLDCAAAGCDFDYLRTKLTWVDHVRDRTAADVHVIVTSLGAGGGGREVTIQFSGRGRFAGVDDEIHFATPQGASNEESRAELARVLALGLARYAVRLPGGRGLAVGFTPPRAGAATGARRDPWRHWVFSAGMNGYLSGESSTSSRDVNGSLDASRTTKDWRFELGLSGSNSHSSFELSDGTPYASSVHSYYLSGVLVRSVSDHLSVGASFGGSSSSQENIELYSRVAPTIEYNVFNYAEYTKRTLLLQYSVGINHYHYTETTIFGRDRETRLRQRAAVDYSTRTTWGSASVGLEGGAYLSDASQNRLSVSTDLNVRVAKGLAITYGGSYARIRDQITLPRAGASDEEILLRLKRLRTNYQYFTYAGLSYTFGSVLNNVVNRRLSNLDR